MLHFLGPLKVTLPGLSPLQTQEQAVPYCFKGALRLGGPGPSYIGATTPLIPMLIL